ncbi:MAG: tRNA pseudouridine(38-40) synthase TruA [Salinispira sp.]
MRNIKLTIAYDGTDFQGWQIQKDARTVQGEMERALSRMHKNDIKVVCAGRTDSGVHAKGQVINFFSQINDLAPSRFTRAVSSFLPGDISVMCSEHVDDDFHARYCAQRRHYAYYIFPSPVRIPQYRRYSLRVPVSLDIERLNRMASVLMGEHDFSTFSVPNEQIRSSVRKVFSASFHPDGDFIVFRISAEAFLWKMVRSIVGSLLEFEQKGYTDADVRSILLARDRSLAGMTAHACGLFLDRVEYGSRISAISCSGPRSGKKHERNE